MKRPALLAIAACLPLAAGADEGMWTFDNPPRAALREKYGVELTDAWLDRVRDGTVRLEGGCSASFISPTGLMLTNHHCASRCIADNSTAGRDLLEKGFLARAKQDELSCPNEAASVLVGLEEVTARVHAATRGLEAGEAVKARRAELTKLEQGCEESARASSAGALKCEAVTLYDGGQYWIYRYRRYDDVRLVFAPEEAIGSYGGDVDNFQFPRWTLDMAILRAYDDGAPAATPGHLRFEWEGATAGEPVFVSGHPGGTSRKLTVAELDAERDVYLPFWLVRYAELRGRLIQFAKTGEEPARIVERPLHLYENSIKVRRKHLDALGDDAMMARRGAEEAQLQDFMGRGVGSGENTDPYDTIAAAQEVYRDIVVRHTFLEGGAGFNSVLFNHARALVRAAAERPLPNEKRLRQFTDARLPALEQFLRGPAPVYPQFEKVTLSFSLERMREWLGPDDPVVKQVFGRHTPDSLAARLIEGSRLADPAVRMALYEGGQAAIEASEDTMIRLALLVDPASRALRERMEDDVAGPTRQAHEAIAAARFGLLGTSVYPDATFTLRFSYGAVEGWEEKGEAVLPFTSVGQAFERATGRDPFRVPESWLSKSHEIDMATPLNFSASLDIIGGNSGSPVVNVRGDIVGLAFDGNIHSIAGSYWYNPVNNRAIAVDVRAIRLALETVYGAKELLREIDGAQ